MTKHSLAPLRRLTLSLPILAAVAGCGAPHVTLRVPETAAPPETRLAAYSRLAPRRTRILRVTDKYGTSVTTASLDLGDGTRVAHAEDLLPAVEPNSATAQSIAQSRSRASTASWLLYTGIGALVGGFALVVSDFAARGGNGRGVPFYAGIGLGLGGLIEMTGAQYAAGSAELSRNQAFKSYDNDLLRRLDLCVDEKEAAPCQ